MTYCKLLFTLLTFAIAASPLAAQAAGDSSLVAVGDRARNGFYVNNAVWMTSGGSIGNSWNAAAGSNARPLSADPGLMYTVALGYRRGQWRTEAEFGWAKQYVAGPLGQMEAGADTSYVYNLAMQSSFGNLYRVFTRRGQFVPYAGLGIGRVNASIDYQVGSQRGRNHDSTGDLIVCLISFLTACGDGGTFHDELVGYRLFGGVDYVTGRLAFDLRLGWMGMTPFEGQGSEDGVLYGLETDHLSSIFGSIGLSWRFLNWP